MRDRYSLVVGLLFAAVVVIAVSTQRREGDGTLGPRPPPAHWPLPEFAVPLAAGGLEGDANVAQDDCATSQLPCPADARRTPACRVRRAGLDPRLRPLRPALGDLVLVHRKATDCVDQQDVVSGVYERYRGRVGFLSLDVRDDRDTVRDLVRERGWKMPVGFDRDGAVAGLYRVGGCPTFAYVYPGGTLQSASIGDLTRPSSRPGSTAAARPRAPPSVGGG